MEMDTSCYLLTIKNKDDTTCTVAFILLCTCGVIEGVSILGHKEACSSDHFGVNLKIKLNVSLRKTVKRKNFNYAKADWRSLNFDLSRIDWHSYIGMHDLHESWQIFKIIIDKLCERHISKKTLKNQFQPPWYDSDCDKILREKEKWRKKIKF